MLKKEAIEIGQQKQESYSVQTTEELLNLVIGLQKLGRIKGVGFDVFDTILKSLYTDEQMTLLLSRKISTYLNSHSILVSNEDSFEQYNKIKKDIKNNRVQLNIEIPVKQQECPETVVIEAFGKIHQLGDIKKFTDQILSDWVQFDLQNVELIESMPKVISEMVRLFGKKHVGIYTNNSYEEDHLISILQTTGYLGDQMIDVENVCTSSKFGLQKYGVGLRKPNILAFNDFSAQLGLDPKDVAFIGDGENDVLFAMSSGGVGIRLCSK